MVEHGDHAGKSLGSTMTRFQTGSSSSSPHSWLRAAFAEGLPPGVLLLVCSHGLHRAPS